MGFVMGSALLCSRCPDVRFGCAALPGFANVPPRSVLPEGGLHA